VTIIFLQHVQYFSRWWAQIECQNHTGLASRFLFGFGASSSPGPTVWQNFGRDVAFPLLQGVLEAVLLKVGPMVPRHGSSPAWHMPGQQGDLVRRSLRLACQDAGRNARGRVGLVDGLQKCTYWLAQTSLLMSLVAQVWPQIVHGFSPTDVIVQSRLEDRAVPVAVCF